MSDRIAQGIVANLQSAEILARELRDEAYGDNGAVDPEQLRLASLVAEFAYTGKGWALSLQAHVENKGEKAKKKVAKKA